MNKPAAGHASSTQDPEHDLMPDFVVLPREPHESARVWSYRVLLFNIVHLHLPPGSCLVESEVRQRLDVSRTPVREALMHLAQEKFVTIIPQKGTYVTRIDMEQVLELRYIRSCVEARTAREASIRMTPELADRFGQCLVLQRKAAKARDFEAFMNHDDAMHSLLYIAAGKPGVWTFFDKNNLHHYRSRILGLRVGRTLARLLSEHEVIVEALLQRDADAAEQGVLCHLAASVWNSDAVLENFPDYIVPPKHNA